MNELELYDRAVLTALESFTRRQLPWSDDPGRLADHADAVGREAVRLRRCAIQRGDVAAPLEVSGSQESAELRPGDPGAEFGA